MHRQPTVVSNPRPVPAQSPVTWIGDPPADEESRVVWQTLTEERVGGYGALVERVAERLFRGDLETFGAVADIGFFQPFYRAHARRLIAALDGTLLRIGDPA
jgi:hypothetical protein